MFGVKHFCELIRPKFSAPHSKPTLPPDPPPLPSPSLLLDCDSPPGVLAARAGRPPHVVGRRVSATLTQPPRAPQLLLPSPFWTRISPPGELAPRAGRPPHCVGRRVLACPPLPLPSLFVVKRPTPRPAAPPVPPGDLSRRAA